MYELVYKLSRDKLDFEVKLSCRVGLKSNKLISSELPKFFNDPSTPVHFYAGEPLIAELERAIKRKCFYYDNMNIVTKETLYSKVSKLNEVQNNLKELLIRNGWLNK